MKFSIRDRLLVAMIVVLAAGWGVDHAMLAHAQRQQAIVQSLLQFDGTVQALYGDYHYTPPPTIDFGEGGSLIMGRGQRVHGFSVMDEQSGLQRLLVPLFGEHNCARVSAVYWDDKDLRDKDLLLLGQVPQLRELHLDGNQVSDAGLSQIAGLRHLVVLDLSSTRVTSRGIRQLELCTELRELDIRRTEVKESDVHYLREALPDCEIQW